LTAEKSNCAPPSYVLPPPKPPNFSTPFSDSIDLLLKWPVSNFWGPLHDGEASKIEQRFNPREISAVPSSIKRLIQPDPRDIDEIIWCKLIYAAATLTEEDYSVS
jgi:hypothetical protein